MKPWLFAVLVAAVILPVRAEEVKPAGTPPPEAAAVAPAPAPEKPALWANVPIQFYGYLKLDAAWDQVSGSGGNYARWVDSAPNSGVHFLSMTARESRLGFNFLPGVKSRVKGKFEMDFYNAGGGENKNDTMLRHAYLEYDWAEKDLSVLAGQTSDVTSPLTEPTVNYVVGWWCGNIGYRRPQVRFTAGTGRKDRGRALIQASVDRTIGDSGTSGEASGYPTAEGRLAKSLPLGKDSTLTIGASGHWGEEKYAVGSEQAAYTTSSLGGDLEWILCKKASLKGEGWWGRNLDAFLGGIDQGVNSTLKKEIRARGGWASLSVGPFGAVRLNAGAGYDMPCVEDLNNGAKTLNKNAFVNCFLQVDPASRIGLEASHWRTEYKNLRAGESTRAQLAFYYDF